MDRTLRARVLMAEATELGVTIDDLIAAATALEVRAAPVTVAEFVATIAPTFSPNTAATYATYWRLAWPASATGGSVRSPSRTAPPSWPTPTDAPNSRASSDGRPSRRRLDHPEIEELVNAVRTTSNDPDLDLLLIRFHLESGARREGALNLRDPGPRRPPGHRLAPREVRHRARAADLSVAATARHPPRRRTWRPRPR